MKIPASYHQERLWLIDRSESGPLYESTPLYHNIPLILNIRGALKIDFLEKSIRDVIERHEALRTQIVTIEEKPVQVVNEQVDFSLKISDVSRDGISGADEKTMSFVLEEREKSFRIDKELLIRGRLFLLEKSRFILVITVHHIVADRYSLRIMAKEIFSIYDGYVNRKEVDLPALPIHYADFSQWQLNLPRDYIDSLLSYWKIELPEKLQALELAADNPRRPVHVFEGKNRSFSFSKPLSDKIRTFTQINGVDEAVLFLAAFKVLLHKYTGQDEIVVGTNTSNRKQPGTEPVIGPIANLLVLRSEITGGTSFNELLLELEKTVTGAHEYQAMPFEKLVLELNPDKDMSRTALFDVLFYYEDSPPYIPPTEGLEIDVIETNLGLGKYVFNFFIRRDGDSFSGYFVYNGNYYRDAAIIRLIGHYERLLDRMIGEPALPVSDFSLLTDGEKQQLLRLQRQSRANYPADKTIHRLFEEQVERVPDHVAVQYLDNRLTYKELNSRANRLAVELRVNHIKPGTVVAMLLEKSFEMIVGIIGILKAGGAYLPIDPEYPEDRIMYMLDDANIPLVITDSRTAKEIAFVPDEEKKQRQISRKILFLDQLVLIPGAFADNPVHVNRPADTAYVIYTSGTTGRPKGAVVEHRNVVGLMFNDKFMFDFGSRDVWTMFHSCCFDFSVWEMYGALLYGGKLILIPRMIARDTGKYLELLKEQSVTILNQTPTAFYNLTNAERSTHKKELHIRYAIFGGEALNVAQLRQWREKYPGTSLINLYGLTETTVIVTCKEISEEDIEMGIDSIGKPIPTLDTYVMDSHLNPVPIGIKGELYVSGDGICRGYLNRPGLTAGKFVRNPFRESEVLYRSGDLVRLRENEDLEYSGRIDDQVKIRGFRIELGEIERQLLRHDSINEVAAAIKEDQNGDKYLCAYMIAETEIPAAELRNFLRKTLADYMIPSCFVRLEKFPVTTSGKVDRKRFPEPDAFLENAGILPESFFDKKIAGLWSEVLNVDRELIGMNSNFFELGGHSIKATLLISKILKHFQVKVPLKQMFAFRDLSKMSEYLNGAAENIYVSIPPVEKKEYYVLSPQQRRLYILKQMEPDGITYNLPQVFFPDMDLDIERLENTFKKIIKRHNSLRTSFELAAGEPVQRIHENVEFSVELMELETFDQSTIRDFEQPFDLSRAPLLRVAAAGIGTQKVLLIDMHHIITDGVSHLVQIEEFMNLYTGSPLPPLKLHYTDYAEWLNSDVQKVAVQRQEDYWLKQFEGEIPALRLPLDYPRPQVRSFAGDEIFFEIGEEETLALYRLSKSENVTKNTILLTFLYILLSKTCNQQDIIVGTFIFGRRHHDLERVIGMFVNTLALRNYPRPGKTFMELLNEVKESTANAYENQEYPFESLVEKLNIEREKNRNPLFDIMFGLHNVDDVSGDTAKDMEVDRLNSYGYKRQVAHFDMILTGLEFGEKILLLVQYSTEIFKRETMDKMINDYLQIIKIVSCDYHIKIEDIEITSDVKLLQDVSFDVEFNI